MENNDLNRIKELEEKVDKTIKYSEYLAENLNLSIAFSEYLASKLEELYEPRKRLRDERFSKLEQIEQNNETQ